MSEKNPYANKRRNYFIDHKFQTKFIFKFCAVIIVSSLLIGLLIFYFAQSSTTVAIENTKILIKPTSDFIFPILSLTILAVCVFSSFVAIVMTVFISHRIAGPAYRLKKEVTHIAEGKLNRNFTMRQKDQLIELAEALDHMTKTFRDKHTQIRSKCKNIEETFGKLPLDQENDAVKDFKKHIAELKETIDYFDLQ